MTAINEPEMKCPGRWLAVLAILWLGALSGCATMTQIRVENASEYDFCEVSINGQGYGDIEAGEISDYKDVKLKFRYALVRLTADGYDVNAQTLNFRSKRFTHRIDVIDLAAGHLGVEIVREPEELQDPGP